MDIFPGRRNLLIAAAALGLLVAVLLPAGAIAKDASGQTVSASDLVAQLSSGQPVRYETVTVAGILDLTAQPTITVPLRCIKCRFEGISAPDVVFERIVDLNGSTIEGKSDFSASVFRDRALFDGATFKGEADFTSGRFGSDVSFSKTAFDTHASFTRAQMDANALFRATHFRQGVDFGNAQLQGRSTFAKSVFDQGFREEVHWGSSRGSGMGERAVADFTGTVFAQSANFVRARFIAFAQFKEVELRAGGNFTFAVFHVGFSMEGANSSGMLSFKGVQIYEGKGRFLHFTSSGTISFLDIAEDAELSTSNLSAAVLLMDPKSVAVGSPADASPDSVEILKQIEASARERKELVRANDARFELLRIENASKQGIDRLADLLYRDVFGYLVRPYRPLLALGLLIIVAGLFRSLPAVKRSFGSVVEELRQCAVTPATFKGNGRIQVSRDWAFPLAAATPVVAMRRSAEAQAYRLFSALTAIVAMLWALRRFDVLARSRPVVLGLEKTASGVLKGIATATTLAVRRKPSIEVENTDRVSDYLLATFRWSEFLSYKILVAAFLLALGNSNATISQLLSAVIG